MADENLLGKVRSLSDLELAFLLSLVAREHCQIRTCSSNIPDLVAELRLVAQKIFRLRPVVVSCTPQTTLDDFASALLLPTPYSSTSNSPVLTTRTPSSLATRSPRQRQQQHFSHDGPSSYFHATSVGQSSTTPSIAPVILAANLDAAPKAVQIQALELLRTRRVFTRTSVHTAPKTFLFVAIVSDDRQGEGLNRWLNEWFYIAHAHSPEDGYPNLEEEDDDGLSGPHLGPGAEVDNSVRNPYPDTDAASATSDSSVVINPPGTALRGAIRNGKLPATTTATATTSSLAAPDDDTDEPVITESDISHLSQLSRQVHVDVDVIRYLMNVVSFLRMHRAVAGGVTPAATKHFEQLTKSLAPLHGLDYVTPSLVQLAARKVYLHRIQIVAPERERSMQWGSELAAVEAVLQGVERQDVIDDVLGMVTVPL